MEGEIFTFACGLDMVTDGLAIAAADVDGFGAAGTSSGFAVFVLARTVFKKLSSLSSNPGLLVSISIDSATDLFGIFLALCDELTKQSSLSVVESSLRLMIIFFTGLVVQLGITGDPVDLRIKSDFVIVFAFNAFLATATLASVILAKAALVSAVLVSIVLATTILAPATLATATLASERLLGPVNDTIFMAGFV